MERKNMVLLTVIAVATLLVAVVGATFAYFTATTSTSGSVSTEVTTSKVEGATVSFISTDSKFERLDYPGGLAVYGAKATIAKKDADANIDYEATFSLKIEYTNQTSTPLDWELYMTKTKDDELKAAEASICELKQNQDGTQMQFWYADHSQSDSDNTQSCSGSAIQTKLEALSATKIASGQLKANTESGEITKDDEDTEEYKKGDGEDDLSDRKIDTKTTPDKYYYLVVKYPNTGTDQTEPEKKTISISLLIDGQAQISLVNS